MADPAPAPAAPAGLQMGPRTIGVPKELYPGERRVALVPSAVQKLCKRGFKVVVEHGAGAGASFLDQDYAQAGATLADAAGVWSQAELVVKVRGPMPTPSGKHEADLLKEGAWLISFIWPAQNRALLDQLAARKVTVLAMDMVPRITRAQKLDALSVMGNIVGYRAVLEGAHHYGRTLGGQMTAAGKVKPATVFVLGAGVAGLAAIGAARNLGAQVKAFDTRAVVREQVESMGGQFVEMKFEESGEGEGGYAKEMSDAFVNAEQALIAQHAKDSDIIITTALIPGKKAPVLVNSGAVVGMPRGSVIVDLAAEQGGNCALTERDKVIEKFGVTIVGSTDLASKMSLQASELYSGALVNLVDEILGKADGLKLNFADEVQRSMTVTKEGEITWPPPKMEMRAGAPRALSRDIKAVVPPPRPPSPWPRLIGSGLLTAALAALGLWAPPGLLSHVTIFLLACVVGWQVVWNVTPALHTPLMSVTNAISGIILIGGMLLSLSGGLTVANLLAAVAVLVAAVNVAGGFLVTQRMLKMFRR